MGDRRVYGCHNKYTDKIDGALCYPRKQEIR